MMRSSIYHYRHHLSYSCLSLLHVERFFKEVESKHTFKDWLCIGRKDSLKETGSYIAKNILDEPIVVVRKEDGQLAGYYNVCRHHAAQICDEGTGRLDSTNKVWVWVLITVTDHWFNQFK